MEVDTINIAKVVVDDTTTDPVTMSDLNPSSSAKLNGHTETVMTATPSNHNQSLERERSRSPQLTDALEALLGGLKPAVPPAKSQDTENSSPGRRTVDEPSQPEVPSEACETTEGTHVGDDAKESEALRDSTKMPTELETTNGGQNTNGITLAENARQDPAADIHSLDTTIDLNEGTDNMPTGVLNEDVHMSDSTHPTIQDTSAPDTTDSTHEMVDASENENEAGGGEHPEWEIDSSPIESSDDDSSDESSSEEDSDDEDNAYKLLSPEEQARILMADAGSDDEGEGKKKGTSGPGAGVKSKNEITEVVIPKPDVTITTDMSIVNLGVVETIVQNIALIKGRTSGEYQVLESGSVLCLEDRKVIGVVAEPLGRVQQPLYSVMFTNGEELAAAGLSVGTRIFYSEKHAKYVFTQALKAFKGSDASNIHDEEVGDDEMEFSDDEAELAHRQKVNAAKRGARGRGGRTNRGGHPLQQQHTAAPILDYDEAEDGPYKTLTRPASLAQPIGHGEAPQDIGHFGSGSQHRGSPRGGRGDRGRGRGDRGRGRGGFQDRGSYAGGYQSSQNQPSSPRGTQRPQSNENYGNSSFPAPPQTQNFYNIAQQFPTPPNHNQYPPWSPFPPQQNQQQQQQPYQQPGFHQAFQNMQHQNQGAWPPAAPIPPFPNGGHFNPAFFGAQPGTPNQWSPQRGNNSNAQNR